MKLVFSNAHKKAGDDFMINKNGPTIENVDRVHTYHGSVVRYLPKGYDEDMWPEIIMDKGMYKVGKLWYSDMSIYEDDSNISIYERN